MRVKLIEEGQLNDTPQQATFDTANESDLDTIATIMQLDPNEIQHHLEEDGVVSTSDYTLLPDDDWCQPERFDAARNWLDSMWAGNADAFGDMTTEIYDTLLGCLEYTATGKDAEAYERMEIEQEDERRQEQVDHARSRTGVFVVGWNRKGYMPDAEPTEVEGTIGEAWELAADFCDEGTEEVMTEEPSQEQVDRVNARDAASQLMREVMVTEGSVEADGFEFWVKEGERG